MSQIIRGVRHYDIVATLGPNGFMPAASMRNEEVQRQRSTPAAVQAANEARWGRTARPGTTVDAASHMPRPVLTPAEINARNAARYGRA